MDWGSLAGLALALAGILLGQKIEGGAAGALLQPAAFVIVVSGTAGAVLLQSGAGRCLAGLRLARRVFVREADGHEALRRQVALWQAVLRRDGVRGLEQLIGGAGTPLAARGLRLVVDGSEPRIVRELLERDIDAEHAEQRLAARTWESAGGYAPTIGILGAVLGLIHVMENLAEPARLGSGIAVAFVSTIYGVGLANLVCLPVANRLKAMLARDALRAAMLADVFVGMAGGESHWLLDDRLAAYPR